MDSDHLELSQRPRRLRMNPSLSALIRETNLTVNDLMLPIFIKEGNNIHHPISSMPGCFQFSIDTLDKELEVIAKLGVKSVMLFGIPLHKDAEGTASLQDDGIVQRAIKHIKKQLPDLLVTADVCLCEYTDHGHCGVLNGHEVHNDRTIALLAQQAVSFARAGVDMVSPSAMMDGMVLAIRRALDQNGYTNIPIMSHAVKYASSMYGPFREAAEGPPKFGNRKAYQADYANSNEALKEVKLDIEQGADIIMVKPAHTYLDIIHSVKQNFPHTPLAAYHVSGEYALIKAAAQNSWINEREAVLEVTTAIKRAGANLIVTYFAKDLVRYLL